MNNKATNYPMEYLILQLKDANSLEEFIEMDAQIWTTFLQRQSAFIEKEVWINQQTPGELHLLITWESMEGWNSVDAKEKQAVSITFKEHYTKAFEIKQSVHKQYANNFIKVSEFTNPLQEVKR